MGEAVLLRLVNEGCDQCGFAEWIFWGSLSIYLYAYAGYLLVLVAYPRFVAVPS